MAERAAAKNARRIGKSLVGDGGRRFKSSGPQTKDFHSIQSSNFWIYYTENRENEREPDQRPAGLCRGRRKSQPDGRRAPARPVAAIDQPRAGGDRAGCGRRADPPDDAPLKPDPS